MSSARSMKALGIAAALLLLVGVLIGTLTLILALGLFSTAANQKRSHDAAARLDLGALCSGAAVSADGRFANPLVGVITSPFGPRENPFGPGVLPPGFISEENLIFHNGVDVAGVPAGTPFYAAASGVVTGAEIGGHEGGNLIEIDAGDGYVWQYLHAADGTTVVKAGQHVTAGDPLAGVGETGAARGVHLHLGLKHNGTHVDPQAFLAEQGLTLGQGAPSQVVQTGHVAPASSPVSGEPKKDQAEGPAGPVTVPMPGGSQVQLMPAQQRNAAVIIGVGRQMGLTDQAIIVALMTAIQETRLLNLASPAVPESLTFPHDQLGVNKASVGLFQQQHTMGWGTVASLMDPEYATRAFFGGPTNPSPGGSKGLLDYPQWESMSPGDAAQMVQMSRHPDLYHQWQATSTSILQQVDGASVTQCKSPQAGAADPEHPADQKARSGEGTTTVKIPAGISREAIVAAARSGVGGEYVWGQATFRSWDASGLVSWVYADQGMQIPRTDPWTAGRRTDTPQPGDVVAQNWDPDRNRWEHVGIYVGQGRMVSAVNEKTGTREHPVTQTGADPVYFDLLGGQ